MKSNQTSGEIDLISRGLLLISSGRVLDGRWEFNGDKGAFLLAKEDQYEADLLQWEKDARAIIAKQEVDI